MSRTMNGISDIRGLRFAQTPRYKSILMTRAFFVFSTILLSSVCIKYTLSFQVVRQGTVTVSPCRGVFFVCESCKKWTERRSRPRIKLTGIYGEPKDDQIAEDNSSRGEDVSEEKEEEKKAIGNLVADDEWIGLSVELSELVRTAVVEDMKKNAREFLGKDEYKIGDISKEIDKRVKDEVASMRDKDEYELGDFVLAMDEMSKNMTEDLTGKPYEFGDLSREIDKRIKEKVAAFCGKDPKADEYEFGDLTLEIDRRIKSRVEDFTGKPYEFGDITREVEIRRKEWIEDYLGKEAAENYEFGDITKKAVKRFTGKDEYEFGDITKKLLGNVFGPKKRNKKEDN